MLDQDFQSYLDRLPLIAILRGLTPDQALDVAGCLIDAGFSVLEVPLNSPDAFKSIELISDKFGDQVLTGAGTVLNSEEVDSTIAAGGRLIVAPNTSKQVADAAVAGGCVYLPGVATPSEAFNAMELGAHGLKLFPAEIITPGAVKAMRAVLPASTRLFPVGGIGADNVNAYLQAGANGLGVGSSLYKPDISIFELSLAAEHLIRQFKKN